MILNRIYRYIQFFSYFSITFVLITAEIEYFLAFFRKQGNLFTYHRL